MPVWQFTIALLPQDWLDAGRDVHALFGEGGFDAAPAWGSLQHPKLEELLGNALSKGKSWYSDLTVWGNEQTDYIQLSRRKGKVTSVVVRFDLRQPNMFLFQHVIYLAQELRLAIVVLETESVVPPDVEQLLRAAAESKATHFVLDPESFLSQMESVNTRAT
jgi:hypothetical protein